MSLEKFHKEDNVSLDVAKALLDFGILTPTMYFPLIVSEALMVEPTKFSRVRLSMMQSLHLERFMTQCQFTCLFLLHVTTPMRRLDEVKAAKSQFLKIRVS